MLHGIRGNWANNVRHNVTRMVTLWGGVLQSRQKNDGVMGHRFGVGVVSLVC